METEFYQFQQTCAQHGGHRQKERKLCGSGPGNTQQQRAHNGGAGAGSTGNHGQSLKKTDEHGGFVINLTDFLHLWCTGSVPVFNDDERNAVKNQHDGNGDGVTEMGFQKIVQQQTQHRRGNAGGDHVEPHGENRLLNDRLFPKTEGPHFMPEYHHNSQNRTQLNDHKEHFLERFRHIQSNQIIQQEHVSGAADGQPLRNTLYNPNDNDFP